MNESHSVTSISLQPNGLYSQWTSPGQNSGLGSLSFLQVIFSTQESNPGLLHCRQILCQLSHMGSPRILEWVAYLFSSRSPWPVSWTRAFCIAGRFFTNWTIRKVHNKWAYLFNSIISEWIQKSYILYNSNYLTFWKRLKYGDKEKISGSPRVGKGLGRDE